MSPAASPYFCIGPDNMLTRIHIPSNCGSKPVLRAAPRARLHASDIVRRAGREQGLEPARDHWPRRARAGDQGRPAPDHRCVGTAWPMATRRQIRSEGRSGGRSVVPRGAAVASRPTATPHLPGAHDTPSLAVARDCRTRARSTEHPASLPVVVAEANRFSSQCVKRRPSHPAGADARCAAQVGGQRRLNGFRRH